LELLAEIARTMFAHCWAQKMSFQTSPFFIHWWHLKHYLTQKTGISIVAGHADLHLKTQT